MLDTNTPTAAADWRSSVTAGDVLLFRFPLSGDNGASPIPRPCLVLDVEAFGDLTFVVLAHGASYNARRARRLDVVVTQSAERRAAGCRNPIAFRGDVRLLVSLRNSRFAAPAGADTPVLGRLYGTARARLLVVRDLIRLGKRPARRGATCRQTLPAGRTVIVEYRRRNKTPGSSTNR